MEHHHVTVAALTFAHRYFASHFPTVPDKNPDALAIVCILLGFETVSHTEYHRYEDGSYKYVGEGAERSRIVIDFGADFLRARGGLKRSDVVPLQGQVLSALSFKVAECNALDVAERLLHLLQTKGIVRPGQATLTSMTRTLCVGVMRVYAETQLGPGTGTCLPDPIALGVFLVKLVVREMFADQILLVPSQDMDDYIDAVMPELTKLALLPSLSFRRGVPSPVLPGSVANMNDVVVVVGSSSVARPVLPGSAD